MDWTKVTPETMPPDKENVLLTFEGRTTTGRYNKGTGYFEGLEYTGGYSEFYPQDGVTHWMPYPKPAED